MLRKLSAVRGRIVARIGASLRRDRRGSSAVEFALLAPMVFAMLGGVLDIGRLLWLQTDLHQAVRAGMQHIIANTSLGSAAEVNRVEAVIAASTGLSSGSGWTLITECGCGTPLATTMMTSANSGITGWGTCQSVPCTAARRYVRVQMTYRYTALLGSVVPFLPNQASTTVTMRIQ